MSNYSRSRTRKFLYQMLYASTFSKIDLITFKESFFSGIFTSQLDEDYLNEMFKIILENQGFLLEVIKKYAPKFDKEYMDMSYIIPVCIGISEIILFNEEIPLKVSINEAVEISKVYGDDSSRKIVNGVLNAIVNDIADIKNNLSNFNIKIDSKSIFKS